ncbi:MAG: hypothetical protein V3W44_06910 [Dehalococcoidales bacterium]
MARECACVDGEQAEDVWAWPVEECAWVVARLDGDQDQACGVRTEADAARVDSATAPGVGDGAENFADTMGADAMGAGMETVIDRCEYVQNNCCE